MKSAIEKNNIVIYPEGRIYGGNCAQVENEIMSIIDNNNLIPMFDMSELDYISSAGLRILIKSLKKVGEKICIRGCSDEIYSIFETTGITELFEVTRKMKEISVESLEVIGKGFYGTVYRIDEDTIVKVYDSPDSIDMIKNEKEMAKLAFINGIPTAISYDIVKVGKSYGSVFELLNAKSFNDIICEDAGQTDRIVGKYAKLLKLVNGTEIEDPRLSSAKKHHINYLDNLENDLGQERKEHLLKLLDTIPESKCVVHGDPQMKNVLLVDEEPMLIDMDTLSLGSNIFDLAALYVTYKLFKEDKPDDLERFLGIPNERGDYIWERFLKKYFDNDNDSELKKKEDKIRIVASIRFLQILTESGQINSELGEIRLSHTIANIDELLTQVEDLVI